MVDIFTDNTEEKFLMDLQDHVYSNPSNRCLFFRFSQIDCDHQGMLPGVLAALESVVLQGHGSLYVMHDCDLFLINRSLTYRSLEKFYTHLTPNLLPASGSLKPGLASLFEIGVDKDTLHNIAKAKIESLKQSQRPRTDRFLVNIPPQKAMDNIDDKLIATLRDRRQARKKAEVLVAEDDAFSRMLVSTVLEGRYDLEMVMDGQAALMNYVRSAPDVLFLDIGLPDIDGHEVLERIFEIDPGAYVVMFSGHGDVYNVTKAMELGAKGFLSKPFTKDKLLRFIEKSPYVQAKKGGEIRHGNSVH